jgi:hypothetical protein
MARSNKVSVEWNNQQFNKFIADFIRQTGADTALVLRKFALDLVSRIVMRTPVATGRARAGWAAAGKALGIDVPRPRRRKAGEPPYDPGEYEEKLTGDRQFIRIANNVDYIMPLEFGHSAQAPFGMVRISMAELRSNQDLATELMQQYQSSWNNLGSAKRYKVQGNVLRDVLGQVKNLELPARRPK